MTDNLMLFLFGNPFFLIDVLVGKTNWADREAKLGIGVARFWVEWFVQIWNGKTGHVC